MSEDADRTTAGERVPISGHEFADGVTLGRGSSYVELPVPPDPWAEWDAYWAAYRARANRNFLVLIVAGFLALCAVSGFVMAALAH